MHITNFDISIQHTGNTITNFPNEYSKDYLYISICRNIKCQECSSHDISDKFTPLILFQDNNSEIKFICPVCWQNATGNTLSKNMKERIKENIFNLEVNEKIRTMGSPK